MAKNQDNQTNLNSIKSSTFNKGLIKDFNDSFVPEGVWINAINMVNASHLGDNGTIGNEPSNKFCVQLPYDIVGIVRRDPDTWVIFSTNDVLSEVGLFTESTCSYSKVISDKCLNFKKTNLITGYIQYNYDCTWSVFFADGLNPDRALNLDNPPYQITGYSGTADCPIPIYSECLDCDAIRLEYLINPPCYSVAKAVGPGSLLNGSYQAVLAYSINGQRVTNYFTPSNILSMWEHIGVAGGLEITVTSVDTRFEEYELVIVSTVKSQTVARKIGNYSTTQSKIYLDNYSEALPSVELSLIPLVNPIYEKSDKMFMLNGYLLRSGIYSKFEFNYQPLANQIATYWQEIEYPVDYYYKGGYNTSYMRDEQYPFFIRWLYNDGDKSASYHIPGRPALASDLTIINNSDVLNTAQNHKWQVYNTASVTNSNVNIPLGDGGIIRQEGLMGYWESTEKYPISPDVYNSALATGSTIPYASTTYTDYDLCGKAIRHHKMPDNTITHIHNNGGSRMYILGVRFDNIQPPVDNQGNIITNIIGFEILRGSREGNRTIIAKGLINNMRQYSNSNPVSKQMLYQNYPYNDLTPDYFLRTQIATTGEDPDDDNNALTGYKQDYFSFHSPETNFARPFLSYDEVKVYTNEYGSSTGSFDYPYGQPKQKLITNASYIIGLTVGLGIGLRASWGAKSPDKPAGIENPLVYASQLATAGTIALGSGNLTMGPALAGLVGEVPNSISSAAGYWFGPTSGYSYDGSMTFPKYNQEPGDLTGLDLGFLFPGTGGAIASKAIRLALSVATISYYGGRGLDQAVSIIYEMIPFRHYALQFNSHGFYNNYQTVTSLGNTRRTNNKSIYIKDQIQNFDTTFNINNLYRGDYVAINTQGTFPNPSIQDKSRLRVRDTNMTFNNPINQIVLDKGTKALPVISSYYGALKIDYQNQYGQLEGIVEIPVHNCYVKTPFPKVGKIYSTPTLFGGDIYINRYTEKNAFFFFVQWLFNEPPGTAFDYSEYSNVLYPRYWANFDKFDSSAINTPTAGDILNSFLGGSGGNLLSWTKAASSYHHLDRGNVTNSFEVTNAWFYLFNNGIKDFFVESEVNLAFRDYGDLTSQRHYDDNGGYTDYNALFRSDIIKAGNYYKYDYSLSVSKLLSNYVTFSSLLPRDYNPQVAETCYQYYERRMLYSLPQQSEQKRDSWRIYLPNNYKEFDNVVTHVKPINRTGSIILFKDAEPTSVTGVDQLQTTQGVKITVGDGGLFAQPFQTLVNADDEYEYGSCQDTRSAVNTPYGLFWISRDTGKVLNYAGGQIVDIAMNGMRYWFAQNLPNILTTQFPGFTATENTLVGIGCQTIYDTQYELLYFSKKDYKSKVDTLQFNSITQEFYIEKQTGNIIVELGDPEYFEDCSWTISYDPKTKMWLSFHDWHPDYVLGTNDHFYTIKNGGFWKHNILCNSYCNYYGQNYSFEVEMPVNTGATVNTIKSIEYTLEVLNYSTDCLDPYHVLNANFDYAMIYNTEQNSGILNLYLKPYSPVELLQYPKVQTNSIDILFAKEENRYRFNQFWDATRDRGEFSGNQFRMFNTEQNGYKKYLNPNYINYSKSPLERKKFRHYGNRLILGRYVSENLKFNLKVSNAKETLSPR